MDNQLQQLQRAGVHYIKSDSVIILELLENRYHQAAEIDMLINKLLTQLKSSKLKKVKFACPKSFLDSLICTRNRMETIGERVIYMRTFTTPLDVSTLEYEVRPNSCLGMTQIGNDQMRKIMVANECIQNENSVISLQYSFKN